MQTGVLIYFEGESNLQDAVCKKPHSHFTVFKSNCFNQTVYNKVDRVTETDFFIYI